RAAARRPARSSFDSPQANCSKCAVGRRFRPEEPTTERITLHLRAQRVELGRPMITRAMAKRVPMASIDAAWLGMEDPTNLMMVTGVMALDGKVDLKRLRLTLDRRLKPFGRFHQRVVRPRSRGGMPHWEDDDSFDIGNHLSHVALPAPGGDDGLQEMVSELMSVPLDFTKPLWHMHVIDNYRSGSVVLTRVHHSIADGIALVRVMLS